MTVYHFSWLFLSLFCRCLLLSSGLVVPVNNEEGVRELCIKVPSTMQIAPVITMQIEKLHALSSILDFKISFVSSNGNDISNLCPADRIIDNRYQLLAMLTPLMSWKLSNEVMSSKIQDLVFL